MTDHAEQERQTLQRIIALLFSMACTAFRASAASESARRYVMWVLLPAAVCACHAVMRLPIDRSAYSPDQFTEQHDSPEAAVQLAQTFCVLAVLHHYLLGPSRSKREDLRIASGPAATAHSLVSLGIEPSSGGGGCVRSVAGCCAKRR